MDFFQYFADLDDLEDTLLESSSSSDSSDEESQDFCVTIQNFQDLQFKRNFRMAPNQFQSLCEDLAPIHAHTTLRTDIEKVCYVGLWYLRNMESMR